jgi:hypothetical protein
MNREAALNRRYPRKESDALEAGDAWAAGAFVA